MLSRREGADDDGAAARATCASSERPDERPRALSLAAFRRAFSAKLRLRRGSGALGGERQVVGGRGRSWEVVGVVGGRGRSWGSWEVVGGRGRSWEVIGRSWEVVGDHLPQGVENLSLVPS